MVSNQSKIRYVRLEHSNEYIHIQELEVYSGEQNVATVQSEINDERANENEDLNCTEDVYYGRKIHR